MKLETENESNASWILINQSTEVIKIALCGSLNVVKNWRVRFCSRFNKPLENSVLDKWESCQSILFEMPNKPFHVYNQKPIFTCMITQEQTSTNITNQILFLYLCSTMIGHVCFSSIYTIEKKISLQYDAFQCEPYVYQWMSARKIQ